MYLIPSNINPKALLIDYKRVKAVIFLTLTILLVFLLPQAYAAIEGDSWFPIGPAPIQGFFAGGATGRASAIAANPSNAEEIWIGGATGGVWHTRNGGKTWDAISDHVPALAIGAIQVADCDSTGCFSIYAGTGENAVRRDTFYGRGLLIGSRDEFSRIHWRVIDQAPNAVGGPNFDFNLASINDIIIDPRTSGRGTHIYLTLSSGTTVSASEDTKTAPEPASPGGYGIYKSTDNGNTWIKLNILGTEGALPTDLEMVSTTGDGLLTLYAGFDGKGVFKSEDSGATWCPLNDGLPRPPGVTCVASTGLRNIDETFDFTEITISTGNPSIIYTSLGLCPGSEGRLGRCSQGVTVYKSTDSGNSWNQQFSGSASLSSWSRYTHGLAVDPENDAIVLLGGVRLHRSIDNGVSFPTSDGVPLCGGSPAPPPDRCAELMGGAQRIHSDHREILFHPTQRNIVYATGDGGFAISYDGGVNWIPRNDGLPITGFHSVATHSRLGAILGGSQDNGVQIWNGDRIWQHGGSWSQDAGYTLIDKLNETIIYAGGNGGDPYISTNGGFFWTENKEGILTDEAFIMYAPLHQKQSEPYDIYTGGKRLYKTPRGSSFTWQPISPILATGSSQEIRTSPELSTNAITAIGLAAGTSSKVYIGYYLGQLFFSNNPCDNDSCWSSISDTRFPRDSSVSWIAVDPSNERIAYVTFSGFDSSRANVWKTIDGGSTWNSIANGIPAGVPAKTIAVEPSEPSRLWLALDSNPEATSSRPELGSVYKSINSGRTWEPASRGLPNVPVFEFEVDEAHNRIVAGTHGRGAYVLGKAFLANFEGWVEEGIWDIPIYGKNFPPNQTNCEIKIFQTTGNVCAQGRVDAMGATISTDSDGNLQSSRTSFYEGREVAWACFNGSCVDGTNLEEECNDDEDGDGDQDPISTVTVSCGGQTATATILGCPLLTNPPSSSFDTELLSSSTEEDDSRPNERLLLSATAQSREHARSLCSVSIPIFTNDRREDVAVRAKEIISSNPTCVANGVKPILIGGKRGLDEDEFERPPALSLQAPSIQAGQLITAIHTEPGEVQSCMIVNGLGNALLGQLQITKLKIRALSEGASGGTLRITEQTGLGTCAVEVNTTLGQTSEEIAQAIEAAFQQPGIPGPNPHCPSDKNPRDITAHGDSVIFVSANAVKFCSRDSSIGFSFRSEELSNMHPIADAGVPKVDENTFGGEAEVGLDGSDSLDPDSTPGTSDDIISYQWYKVSGSGTSSIGSEKTLSYSFPSGTHHIRLIVTDKGGLSDSSDTLVTVEDSNYKLIILCLLLGLLIGFLLALLIIYFKRRQT